MKGLMFMIKFQHWCKFIKLRVIAMHDYSCLNLREGLVELAHAICMLEDIRYFIRSNLMMSYKSSGGFGLMFKS